MSKNMYFLMFFCLFLSLTTRIAYAFPSATGYLVNDWVDILYSSEESDLESLCQAS